MSVLRVFADTGAPVSMVVFPRDGRGQVSLAGEASSGQVSDRPETLDRKVSKGCESTGFEETCRSGERRGQETLAEHSLPKGWAWAS